MLQLSSFYTAISWAGTAVFHRERKASKQTFDRRQWSLVGVLSLCTALNTLIGRANIAVPTTFDQAWMDALLVHMCMLDNDLGKFVEFLPLLPLMLCAVAALDFSSSHVLFCPSMSKVSK